MLSVYLRVFFIIFFAFDYLFASIENIEKNPERKEICFNIDYKDTCCELCLIGAKYDTDKSSQRNHANGHSHPYTLFYHSIFKDKKNETLNIAELGVLHGASLLMWKEYFKNATIFGFDNNVDFINSFKSKFGDSRIYLNEINVLDRENMINTFLSLNETFDLIIDDTTHQMSDQLRIIESVYPFLKPGGMLIIEDVFKSYDENDYISNLNPILDQFQDYYFVSLEHKNKYSPGWDNDKLFVLVKKGADPIFKHKKKMTLITPCIRPSNLPKIKNTIDFDYVDEWIIVYDGKKISNNPQIFKKENNPKIKEYLYTGEGGTGNPQRNYALDRVQNPNTFLYFLDDDNIMCQDIFRLLDIIDDDRIVTFDSKIKGNNIELNCIDSAMFLVDFKLSKNIRWKPFEYAADFYYINECYQNNKNKWVYVNNKFAFYNALAK